MIEQLVEQIEGRFAELERDMSDPDVIADRERYAAVGREYNELERAHELASEWRTLSGDLAGARELLEDEDDEELRSWSPRRRPGSRSWPRGSAWRWSSATPTTTRT